MADTNSAEAQQQYPLPAPGISPVRGRYEWNRLEGGGVLVSFHNVPDDMVLHWRFEWIRIGYHFGCKFSGFTSRDVEEDYTGSFRIQPHRMGFMKRRRNEGAKIELNYPGKYHLQAWISDPKGVVQSEVSEETYEVVNVSPTQAERQ